MKYTRSHGPFPSLLVVIAFACLVVHNLTALSSSGVRETEARGSVLADSGEIDSLKAKILRMIAKGDSLCEANDQAAADCICNAALVLSDSVYGLHHTLSASCLDCRVKALRKMQELDRAVFLAERSLAIKEKILGGHDLDVAASLNSLGTIRREQGNYRGAKPLLERSLAIREKLLGLEHPEVAASLHNLGILLRLQGDYVGARPLLERAMTIREKVLGEEHPDVAASLNSLGILLKAQGDYEGAKPYFERALAIRERTFSSKHPNVAESLNNLGLILCDQGDYEGARPFLERALAIWEKTLGLEHPDVAFPLENLAVLVAGQGDYEGAKLFLKRALTIREKALGSEHPEVARSLNNLGIICSEQGDYAGARPFYERALVIRERVLGLEHPDVAWSLDDLGLALIDQGDYAGAKSLMVRALTIREKVLGPEHPDVAASLINLANILFIQGDYVGARPLLERALIISERVLGPEHPDVALSLGNLALLLIEQGDYAAARPLLERALAIFGQALGPEHPHVATTYDNLANLCYLEGDYDAVRPLLERALAMREKVFGPEHPDVAASLNSLGILLKAQGDYEGAKSYFEGALAIRERALSSEHPEVTDSQEELNRIALLQMDQRTSWEGSSRGFVARRRQLERIYRISSERQALLYAEKVRDSVDLVASTVAALGEANAPDSVCSFLATAVLQTKGQVLDEISVRHRLGKSGDQEIAAVGDSLKAARLLIATLYARGPEEGNPAEYLPRLRTAISAKEKWELRLATTSITFRAEREEKSATTSSVAACLPEGATLVEFLRYAHFPARPGEVPAQTEERDLACVLTADNATGPSVIYIGLSSVTDSLIKAYRQHIDGIVESGELPDSDKERVFREVGGALYRRLWAPIKEEVGEAELVLISPDASLNLLAFGALPMPDSGYLIERYPIHYLSSGRDLIRLRSCYIPGKGLLAFGDPDFDAAVLARSREADDEAVVPLSSSLVRLRNTRSSCERLNEIQVERLPASGKEVRQLGRVFGQTTHEPVELYLGVDALEDRVKAESGGKRIIHLATHAYYLQGECADARERKVTRSLLGEAEVMGENPLLLSGLFFAGSNLHGKGAAERGMDDGILTAEEICSLDLTGSEWVVLSACETGLGKLKKGEGVFGLRRAFQLAGARTVIMSLWPVGDRPTRNYMLGLYERRLGGTTTVAAMRETTLSQLRKLRRQNRSTHPFTWGAFVAVGDWK